jgi:hypothetical protein
MTLLSFTRTNSMCPVWARKRLARAGGVVTSAVRNALGAISNAILTPVAYRAALKRLEAGVEGNLFDQPVLWAELKSAAWAQASAVAASRSKARPV